MGADANGWFDDVGAHLDQNRIQLDNLCTRHALHLACVGDASEQHTAVRIGERCDLIRTPGSGPLPLPKWWECGKLRQLLF